LVLRSRRPTASHRRIDTLLKGTAHFVAQGWLYPFTLLILFVLSVQGAWTNRERFHAAFSIFFLFYILVSMGINLRLLT
jgi:hypothetical protein